MIELFMKAFDPSNKEHVTWLRDVGNSVNGDFKRFNMLIKNNIFDIKISQNDIMEVAQMHCLLTAKYTQAIFDGTAYIPKYYTRQE